MARAEAAERRLGLRKAVQRALVLGRLYGGGAIVIGTGERDPAALAYPLEDEWLKPGGLKFLHVVSRWQLGAAGLSSDPLSPWCGEPAFYDLAAAGRAPLRLHPSRVVRFLGNPLPDPWATANPWSDSLLQALYDAVHAAALTVAGATSLMHEAKVDVVTVPNLSEHLSSAGTTEQLSARFAYAAAMKSINNLASARRWRDLVAPVGRSRRPARDGAVLPAGGGGGGGHSRHATAGAIALGALGDGRERHPQLLRHDRGAPRVGPAPRSWSGSTG